MPREQRLPVGEVAMSTVVCVVSYYIMTIRLGTRTRNACVAAMVETKHALHLAMGATLMSALPVEASARFD